MSHRVITSQDMASGFFDGAVARILELQRPNGAIPWYDGGVIDPWNHVEAAMGLTVIGHLDEARLAYKFLKDSQLDDGSWWSEYGAAVPMDENHYTGDGAHEKHIQDTNMTAYIATGVWHYYLVTGDQSFLKEYWLCVAHAMEFVLSLQSPEGDIRWASDRPETPEDDALITGCASIYKSLECAILIARKMRSPQKSWEIARQALGNALRAKPERFDRTWASKENYSMDWYYPILTGVLTGDAAQARLDSKWDIFVAPDKGCRCVIDQPWVTIAESCELALALLRMGDRTRAESMFAWQHQWRDDNGAYWMGYQYAEDVPWPEEKPAWTAAAAILTADALTGYTKASDLFTRGYVDEPSLDPAQQA